MGKGRGKTDPVLRRQSQKQKEERNKPELEQILEGLQGTRYYDLAKNDAAWVDTYSHLNGRDREKAYLQWLQNIRNTLTKYAQAASDEKYNEAAFTRELEAEKNAGINADLTGLTGTPQTAAEGDIAGTGAPVHDPMEEFDKGLNRIATIGNVVMDMFSGVVGLGQGIGSVLGTSLDNSEKLMEIITGATEKYSSIRETLRGSDTSDIHQEVMDILFGANGTPGAIQGLSGRQLRKVREAVNAFGKKYGTGYIDKVNEYGAKEALNKGEQEARTAEFNNMVDKVSGIHNTQGKLFDIQAKGMARKAMNDLKILRLKQKRDILLGKFDKDRISLLDAEEAAMAENTANTAAIAKNNHDTEFYNTLSGETLANEQNNKAGYYSDFYGAMDGKSQGEREEELNRLNYEITKAEAEGEIIIKQTELESIKLIAKGNEPIKSGKQFFNYVGEKTKELGYRHAAKNMHNTREHGGSGAGAAFAGLLKKAFAK